MTASAARSRRAPAPKTDMAGTDTPADGKSPDAFRTISEVAGDLDLPQHVLRFWETRFSQIKPMKRGGGRRYYRPEDVDLLRGIRLLLYGEGFTIRGVQRLLKERGAAFVSEAGRNGSINHVPVAQPGEALAEDYAPESSRKEPIVDAPAAAHPVAPPDGIDEPEAEQDPVDSAPIAAPSGDEGATRPFGIAERKALEEVMAELAEVRRLLEDA